MKRELGIARCGLACCLCSENDKCDGCGSGGCAYKDMCENLKCSEEKNLSACSECKEECKKGLLSKIKPYTFTVLYITVKELSAIMTTLTIPKS